jgi:hypothetical protein
LDERILSKIALRVSLLIAASSRLESRRTVNNLQASERRV